MNSKNKATGPQRFRVALLGIYHESNTFINAPTTLPDFQNSHLLKGQEILTEYSGAYHEIGGMIEVLNEHNIEIVPIMFAEATPGGTVATGTFETLTSDMFDALDKALPVDGCLVVPHGAGVAEHFPDMDGHWLGELRKITGPGMPIVGTLDPHANGSRKMIEATNALVAYSTNPHIDQRETGRKAADLLVQFLHKKISPVQAITQAPVAISIEQQYTAKEPCLSLYQYAQDISKEPGILSISILLGFPYADVNEMGTSFIVVSDNDLTAAQNAGERLRNYITGKKNDFVGKKHDINAVMPTLANLPKPVLMLDMGDNVGGGSPGKSAYLLNAVEEFGGYKSFICIYDPGAALKASSYQVHDQFDLIVGDKDEIFPAQQYSGTVELLKITDGKFKEKNPRHGGQVNYNMGLTAIVRTLAGNIIMINSLRVPPFSLSQLTSFEVNPADFDIIVAKGVNAPIAAYSPVCPTIIQINTPGVTQADMTLFNFKNRRKPLFPFEQ